MAIFITLNGIETDNGFLVAPSEGNVFPARLGIRSDDAACKSVEIEVADGGADIELEKTSVEVGHEEVVVHLHAKSESAARDDTVISILSDGIREAMLTLTAIGNPRIFYDGRFEARFSTGRGFYTAPRGGTGWMWLLEDEPDFVPADAVPDRIDKKNVGRTVRLHNPAIDRPHVPPIGVTVNSVIAVVGGTEESFTVGDPVIGLPVKFGDDSYFASNQPVDPADQAAGRLPEEQHRDGFQPMANFEFHLGEGAFSGSSLTGPFVPGTTQSSSPRDPDSRPRASGLARVSAAERAAYPFPELPVFSEARVNVLLPDYEALVAAGNTDSVEFRNLQARIGHLLPNISQTLRDQILADHSGNGMQVLSGMPGFPWGNKEVYRGLIDESITVDASQSPVLDYFSRFSSLNFLGVFYNFHTDESRGGFYGSVDPVNPPPMIGS